MRPVKFDDYIFETLMPDIIGHDRKPSAFIVYLHLWFVSRGEPGTPIVQSLQSITEAVGISKSSVQAAIRVLKRRQLIRHQQSYPTASPVYFVLAPWRRHT